MKDEFRGNSSGGTLDDRANALAQALNKTGVQSLGNPCTVVAFYGTSAILGFSGGAIAGGEAAGAASGVKAASAPFWPYALRWLNQQTAAGFAVLYRTLGKVGSTVQAGCDAVQ